MENKNLTEEDLRDDTELNIDRFVEALVRENLITDYHSFGLLYGIFRNAQFQELHYTVEKTIKTISHANHNN
jgi:hypothetical protein